MTSDSSAGAASVAVLGQLIETTSLAVHEAFGLVAGDEGLRSLASALADQLTATLAADFTRADEYVEAIASAQLERRGYAR
jgi:hypothetical protein